MHTCVWTPTLLTLEYVEPERSKDAELYVEELSFEVVKTPPRQSSPSVHSMFVQLHKLTIEAQSS